jgi:hypothetical protein
MDESEYKPLHPLPTGKTWPKGHWITPGGLSCVREGCRYGDRSSVPRGSVIYLSGLPGAVFCREHAASSHRKKDGSIRRRRLVTAEMVDALNIVEQARPLVRQLLDAKSNEAWSTEEIALLDDLRQLLGIEP